MNQAQQDRFAVYVVGRSPKLKLWRATRRRRFDLAVRLASEYFEADPTASTEDVVDRVTEDLRASFVVTVGIALLVKIMVEWMYAWLRDNDLLPFEDSETE